LGDSQQILLREAVDVAVVGRVALHDPDAGASLPTALRALDAAVVQRDPKRLARLGIQLGEVAAAGERALEHALRKRRIDEVHAASPGSSMSATIRPATSSRRWW